ncbi:MAG: hypothetical protein COB51_04245 [Moraxellaceae bacterium]|nr:MAG: hypothetical protein COB51_04245 [Moraxellaceae bacterium]
MEREKIRSTWNGLSFQTREVAYESLKRNPLGFMDSVNHVLNSHDAYAKIGYTNTFAAGALGGVTSRAAGFAKSIITLERALEAYGNAAALDKAAQKPKVHAAYEQMRRQFNQDLKIASANQKPNGRLGPLKSANQGMKRAQILANNNSSSAIIKNSDEALKVMHLAKYGKVVGKGMIFLDVGLRVNNVAQSDNKARTATSETFGFGFSFTAGAMVYGQCVPPLTAATGPWSLAICLLPAGGAALVMDELGKTVGNSAYDAAVK